MGGGWRAQDLQAKCQTGSVVGLVPKEYHYRIWTEPVRRPAVGVGDCPDRPAAEERQHVLRGIGVAKRLGGEGVA